MCCDEVKMIERWKDVQERRRGLLKSEVVLREKRVEERGEESEIVGFEGLKGR